MASSDNLASLDPWFFRSSFPSFSTDPWLCDDSNITLFPSRDSNSSLITNSITPHTTTAEFEFSTSPSPFINNNNNNALSGSTVNYSPESSCTPTVQSITTSGSELEPSSNHNTRVEASGSVINNNNNNTKKKISKRKSRASKKSPTTFITADAANFRQMVQQITGVKFPPVDNSGSTTTTVSAFSGSILRPEPYRLSGEGMTAATAAGCLPTLDTSAFLLNHYHRQQQGVNVTDGMTTAGEASGGGMFDFDGYNSCFPTLESCSWKVK